MINVDLLLIGGDQDFNLKHLQKVADKNNVSYKTCYTGMSGIPSIKLDVNKNELTVNGYKCKTKSIFLRPDVTTYQKTKNPEHSRLASDWFDMFIGWALANDDIKILNRKYYNRNKVNKVANLLLAKKIGIKIAETHYTNDVYFMEKFNDGNWIEKPVHGGIHTKILDMTSKKHSGNGTSIRPITLQAKMNKPEFRFFRVGNKYRAFSMESPSLDYRENQDAKVTEIKFPEEYKEKFTQLLDKLGLDYGAADYISHPETGELCFLEVNSGPMFTAFDIASNNKLCEDMINSLIL